MIAQDFVVYLAYGRVDLRGSVDRLSAITREVLKLDPDCGALFLFFNNRRNKLKALWFDRNGHVVLYKRLQKGSFAIPPPVDDSQQPYVELSAAEFSRILTGLVWFQDVPDWVH